MDLHASAYNNTKIKQAEDKHNHFFVVVVIKEYLITHTAHPKNNNSVIMPFQTYVTFVCGTSK